MALTIWPFRPLEQSRAGMSDNRSEMHGIRTRFRRFWICLHRSLLGAYSHGALGYAKGAAYSSLLSFFPLLTVVTTLLVNANADRVARSIVQAVFRIAPSGVEDLIAQFLSERGQRPAALPFFAMALALWAASGVMVSLMEGFQSAYESPSQRNVLHQRGIAIWLVFASILPVIGTTSLLIFGGQIETIVLRWAGILEIGETVRGWLHFTSAAIRYLVSFLAIWLVTGMLYLFGPDAGRRRAIWPGAFMSGLLWILITWLFGWYVRNIANYNFLYGSIGAVIALCVWMYLLALVTMIGCEFNIQIDRLARRASK